VILPPGDPIQAAPLARALGWKPSSLARASRDGRGPAGRFLVTGREAAYPRSAVEEWARRREAGSPARLEAARARAEHARAALVARRAGGR
jgi:hypothetical protein